LLVGGLLIRLPIAFWLFPGYDEAYYYLYSQHLDWSYFDHPLLVALTTGIGPWLTGVTSQFTLRIGALFLHTLSLFLLYLTSRQLFNPRAALLTLAIATIIPIFQVGFGVLTLPDNPTIFFWTASLYCAAKEFFPRGREKYLPTYRLTILGILIGLTCLGKYHGFVLAASCLGFCLTSSAHRRAFFSPWGWLAIALFFLTIGPIWFWNLQHDWISFRFQLSSRFEPDPEAILPPEGFNLFKIPLVLLVQIAYLFPTMGIPLCWVMGKALLDSYCQLSSRYLMILWVSCPIIWGFTILGGGQQILPTWTMPGFWTLILLLGDRVVIWQERSRRWVRLWLKTSALSVVFLMFFLLLHVNLGTLQKNSQYAFFGGFIEPQQDPSVELIDIRELRRGFVESPILKEALANASFVFTNAYYLGGLIQMAIEPLTSIPVTCFDRDMRGFAFWWNSQEWLEKDGLYLTLDRFTKIPKIEAEYQSYFLHWQEIGSIPIRRSGIVTEVFRVYRGDRLLKPYPLRLRGMYLLSQE
jgi:hypothetical protein